ncbi:TPA: hypothetical protein SI588_003300 [Escherichia coli]|nr:hypothetical protein [Escherichia coli]
MKYLKRTFATLSLLAFHNTSVADTYLSVSALNTAFNNSITAEYNAITQNQVKGVITLSKGLHTAHNRYCYIAPNDGISISGMYNGLVAFANTKIEVTHINTGTTYIFHEGAEFNIDFNSTNITSNYYNFWDFWSDGFVHTRNDLNCNISSTTTPSGNHVSKSYNYTITSPTNLPVGGYSVKYQIGLLDVWAGGTPYTNNITNILRETSNYLNSYISDSVTLTSNVTVPAVCTVANTSDIILDHGDLSILDLPHTSNKETITVNCNGPTTVNVKAYFVDNNDSKITTANNIELRLHVNNIQANNVNTTITDIWGGSTTFTVHSLALNNGNTTAGSWDLSAVALIEYI